MTTPVSRRAVIGGLTALGPATVLAQSQAGPQFGKTPTVFKPPYPVIGKVTRASSALDALIDADARVEQVVDGFVRVEGPCWVGGADGYLLCSDTRGNAIIKWSPRDGRSVWKSPSGFDNGVFWDPMLAEPGTNGLILARGGILCADCGNRTLSFFDLKTRKKSILVSAFEGKRLNNPNDLVLAPDGSVYFNDPPFAFADRGDHNPTRQLDFGGIFRLSPDNKVTLVDSTPLSNGIALSPDGKTLYSTDPPTGWLAWNLDANGVASNKRVFIDRSTGIMGGDGMKVDTTGHLWGATREALVIWDPKGTRIGSIAIEGEAPSNCEFGADGYLYITFVTRVARVKVKARKIARKV